MLVSRLFFAVFRFLIFPAVITTVLLYILHPLFDCSFPEAKRAEAGCSIPGQQKDYVPAEIAPFRLLAFGDPQLEGDTSLPDPKAPTFPSLSKLGQGVRDGGLGGLPLALGTAVRGLVVKDVPSILRGYRKAIDLWGNDFYLAHIYRTISWWTKPTHLVVLGDLLGSQWIGDEEFQRRSNRFWNRVFKGAERVPRTVTGASGRIEVLGQDESWNRRLIAVAGNHDIGYAGDIDERRIARFENTFGDVNWAIRFKLDNTTKPAQSFGLGQNPLQAASPELRLIILNSMNLDDPARQTELRDQSRSFIFNELQQSPEKSATVLLTHIPLFKQPGLCVDGPFFNYFEPQYGGGIKEQNHLTEQSSFNILGGLKGHGKFGNAIILNGHDHEGCDTYHYRPVEDDTAFKIKPYPLAQAEVMSEGLTGIREITVRSMMGAYHGNAGFLSGWFDQDTQQWKFEYSSCFMGVQHLWWGVHILDLVTVLFGVAGLVAMIMEWQEKPPKSATSKVKKA